MSDTPKLMIVEDDKGLRSQLRWALGEDRGFKVFQAETRTAAMTVLRKEEPGVVILDLGLPPDPNGASEGLATLEEILAFDPSIKVVIASGNEDRANAVRAIQIGAYDFYPKPVDIEVLSLIIDRALRLRDLESENLRLVKLDESSPLRRVVTSSPLMLQNCQLLERVAPATVNVLLTGESGTGKEVMARTLHDLSPRAKEPFIAINCASIPENLLESELFGHEKGSFTGAVRQQIGKVEQAHGGTLFLDEIGDMPLDLQAKILRFLQERTITRIGGRNEIKVDVRVVSATNKNLQEAIAEKSFREDLYYRLDEVTVHLPPLKAREGDSVLLAKFFLARYAKEMDRPVRGITEPALAAINAYAWPGNVRELESRIKRAVILADGKNLTPEDLGFSPDGEETSLPTLKQAREKAERAVINQAMAMTGGNVSAAARLLGVSRPTLYDLLKSLDLGD
ncbi:MAG: PEP-CTERM-box response regulator transcription factor [Magnetospiraceae bacterium]